MKIIILIDWSDNQSRMPEKPGCTQAALIRSRRVMRSFEFWRRKQTRPYRLVLWHTHFPGRYTPPTDLQSNKPYLDCWVNLMEKQIEAVAKSFNPNEPVVLADDTFGFDDDFDLEPLIEQTMQPDCGVVFANNAWVLNPTMQRLIGNLDADPNCERFEKDWTEADFCDWVGRTTWTFAKTYAEKSPHEYAALGKPDTELSDLYKATMFILRNGFVQMYYQTPFMAYEVNNRRYWSCLSYDLVNRTLEGDLKTYQ